MRKPRGYWSEKDNVLNESRKYGNRTEFKKHSNCAYNSARKNGWLNEMTWLGNDEGRNPKGFWKNRENLMNEARKYSDKEEFQKGNLTAFIAAYKYGFMHEMTWLVRQKQHKKGHWTYDRIKREAFKYRTKTDFSRNSPVAYRAALKMGIIDDFFLNDYIEY